jgi:OOP family OmpA-OmpF porin
MKTTHQLLLAVTFGLGLFACKAKVEVTSAPPPPPVPAPAPPPAPLPKLESITVSERIQFETDSAILKEHSKITLNEVVKVLKDRPDVTLIEIGGHTDSDGDNDANLLLSQQRAESVKLYIMSQGIDHNRMRAMGYGERIPVAPNDTDLGKTQNRRVEFRIIQQAGH